MQVFVEHSGGQLHCPDCGPAVEPDNVGEITGYAIDILEGASDEELRAGEADARALGLGILNELPDISEAEAEELLEQILDGRE